LIVTSLLLGVSLGVVDGNSSAAPALPAATATPIEHVVVIYQENHSFDEVLGAICQQRPTPCNAVDAAGGAAPLPFDIGRKVRLADGSIVPNAISPDVVPAVDHDPHSQNRGIAGRWDEIRGCRAAVGYRCITHYAAAQIPNLAALADTYAVSDATYAAGRAASFGAHVEIGAGTPDGFLGFNPVRSRTGIAPVGNGWGCPSDRDARWSPTGRTPYTLEPSCVPESDGSGAYRTTPVPSVTSIMEQLETAGLTWKIYNGSVDQAPFRDGRWNFCNYFAWCLDRRETVAYNPATSVLTSDATDGTLPNVAFVPATPLTGQHNSSSMAQGDNYIGAIMAALQDGPEWSSTAVFIAYDDCGCFYDHVAPPAGLGLRNPMVIASPWVKPGSTDSTTAVQPYSMLAFIDNNFGLQPLTREVRGAYDYANAFDFSAVAPPTTAIAPTVHQHISAEVERRVRQYLRTHPDDMT
jgi:phospholipase C